ncbi:hypothetical protein RIF29_41997 [Crotalaria pallida]|uniref:Spermidine hydroxycinnamoyl transferase n=1 Tax=Crotalaria pallida TaxID=3830 RepID=A0AAN9EBM6_CROPI
MVTITSSYTIVPNEPTPNGRLGLSSNDQVVRLTHASTIYVYKTNPSLELIERMRDSLHKILVHYYPVAGRLRWTKGGRFELDCNAKGVVFLEAESTKTLSEYGDFTPNEAIKDLMPSVDYTKPIEDLPLLLVQLTRFCGHGTTTTDQGITIGVLWSHPMTDGFAFIRFINTWAKAARGEPLEIDELFPLLDRSIIESPHPSSAPRFDHPELKPFPLVLGSSDDIAEKKKKTVAVTLKLTSQQVEKLKKKANDQSQKEGSRPYSRFEVIAAYIWRCASKARQLDQLQPTQVRFVVDIRSRLNPPLSQNYFGNALSSTVTPTCCVGDIISKPLSYVAQKIKEAADLIQNEYIRSQQCLIMGHEQLDEIRTSFQFEGEQRKNSPFYGNPNLSIVSWINLKWYDADFGWGKPMHFGPAPLCPSDRAFIIRNMDDSIIISLHFQIAHMQLFTKFFWEEMLDSKL